MNWLVVHALDTAALAGAAAFTAQVQYVQFASVGRERFVPYLKQHVQRIVFVTGPLVIGEGMTLALAWRQGGPLTHGSLALLLLAWGVTGAGIFPLLWRLTRGFALGPYRALVILHWVRTLAWIARAVLLGVELSTGAHRSP